MIHGQSHAFNNSLAAPMQSGGATYPRMNMHTNTNTNTGMLGASSSDLNKTIKNYKPNELFIGNLSYFCEEKDLFELFDQYGNVEDVRIIKNDTGTRSLMFGFVTMSSVHEAREMEKLLNGHMFMGRRIRVAISERRYDFKPPQNEGIQMHVSCCSFFNFNEQLVKPSESFLRKFFVQFGSVIDITIKEYAVYHEQNMQEGYGFVSFETEDAVMRAIAACQNVIVHGITLKCTITHQHNPHAKKNKKGSPTAATSTTMAMMNMHGGAPKYSNALPPGKTYSQQSMSSMHSMPSFQQAFNYNQQQRRETDGFLSSVGSANNSWNAQRIPATFSSLNPPVPIPGQLSLSNNIGGTTLSSPHFSVSSSVNTTPMSSSIASFESSLDQQDVTRGLSSLTSTSAW